MHILQHALPLDNHHHVEGVSAIKMIVPVVLDGSMKTAMPLEYQRHLEHVSATIVGSPG